jgi:hypothetical protein
VLKYFLFLLFLTVPFSVHGKGSCTMVRDTILLYKPAKEIYLIKNTNFNQYAQLETMASSLVYRGIGAGAMLGLQKRKNNTITSFITHWSRAKLRNNIQPKQYYAELNHININVSACYILNRFQQKKTIPYTGWQLAQQSDFRRNNQLQNSSVSYNFATSLSPFFRIEKWLSFPENKKRKLFKKQRSILLTYQLAIPLLAGVARPPFNSIRKIHDGLGNVYQNSITQEVITQYKLYTLNHFLAVYSNVELQYFIKNGNRLALQYFWNFENFNKKNSAYKVSQTGIQLSFYTRLNAI